jgi:hypothetical protein
MKSVGNDRKYDYHFLSYFFTRKRYGNDTLKNDTNNEKSIHRKRNHRIENMSISIDNGTANRNHEWTYMQYVHDQMSEQQSNMNITAPYAHTITIYDSQLLNFAANKFMSQQPTYRLGCWRWSCPQVGDREWRLKLYIHVGLCYWVMLGLSVT